MTTELNLTPELLEKVKAAPSAAALLTIAQESGITLTVEMAANLYAQLHATIGTLSDEELDSVAGGRLYRVPSTAPRTESGLLKPMHNEINLK